MYLLDTNVVSELRKPRPHGAVVEWLKSVEDASLHLATITLGEIQAGIDTAYRHKLRFPHVYSQKGSLTLCI